LTKSLNEFKRNKVTFPANERNQMIAEGHSCMCKHCKVECSASDVDKL